MLDAEHLLAPLMLPLLLLLVTPAEIAAAAAGAQGDPSSSSVCESGLPSYPLCREDDDEEEMADTGETRSRAAAPEEGRAWLREEWPCC